MSNNWKKGITGFLLLVMILVCLPMSVVEAATYQKGSKGYKVTYLQRNLNFLGFSTNGIDGSFGNNTKKAVIALQKALHMEETGTVDEILYTLLTDTVYDIQLYLKQKGYYATSVDGIVGNGTQNALKAYQKAKGYTQTGSVDYLVLKEMLDDSTAKQHLGALEEYIARMEGIYVEKVPDEAYWEAYASYAQQKMDEMLERLGVKEGGTAVFFTKNQKSCNPKWVGSHGQDCNNCSVTNIMNDKNGWFQKEFGVVDPDNLPNHTSVKNTRGEKGYSCFGFANFAMWYVFQTSDSPDVRAEQVAPEGKFGKEYVIKYNVQPGDILRLDYSHSVVVYAVKENYIEVIDCNHSSGKLQCVVKKRKMYYKGDYYSNEPVCVDRVKYFDESLINTTEVYTVVRQIR